MLTKQTFRQQGATPEHEDSSWLAPGESLHEQFHYIFELACANGRQKEMSFLRRLMLYDDTGEAHQLEIRIAVAERRERCVRRAMWLMGVLVGIALAGLGYSFILVEDIFQNSFQLIIRLSCALGLAAAVSLVVFGGIWAFSRAALDEQLEGCRRLVTRLVESRIGKSTENSPANAHSIPAARDTPNDIKT